MAGRRQYFESGRRWLEAFKSSCCRFLSAATPAVLSCVCSKHINVCVQHKNMIFYDGSVLT